MTAEEFVNKKLGDKNYTHSKYSMFRKEIEEWLNEFAEHQVKLLATPAVSKCVEPVEEGTLIDFFSWLKLKGYLRSNVFAKDIIDLYKSINGC